MNRLTLSLAAAAAFWFSPAAGPFSSAAVADDNDTAKETAEKVTAAGAAMFEAGDARGLSLTYAADGRLEVVSEDKDTGGLKTEVKVGRAEVEAYYLQVFKFGQQSRARNTVEHARMVGPDLLAFSGVFEPDTGNPEALKFPFIQVRHREADGGWKVVSLQLFVFPRK